MTKIVEHDDGTADITKVFLLIPHHEDCGRFVRCDAQQVLLKITFKKSVKICSVLG